MREDTSYIPGWAAGTRQVLCKRMQCRGERGRPCHCQTVSTVVHVKECKGETEI